MNGGRNAWLERRKRLEEQLRSGRGRSTPDGLRGMSPLHGKVEAIGWALKASGLHGPGARNAARPRLNRLEIPLASLPEAFDGVSILFLSDFHLDVPTGAMEAAQDLLRGVDCDIAVFGGDYQSYGCPGASVAAGLMAPLVEAVRARHGIFAVLGNHDYHEIVDAFEALGVRFLLNESVTLERGGQELGLVGCDDIHAFHDPAAGQALRRGTGCRIAVVHSPDFAREAAAAGCSLYLAGHTHGGQICLPGGGAVITALDQGRAGIRGLWRHGAMVGYTSTGLGCGAVPVRFNCPPEVVLITLRCAP